MEQVIRAYGMFILEAAVFTGVIWLLFMGIKDNADNQGFSSVTGSCQEEISAPYLDFSRYRTESEKDAPAIQYVWKGMLYLGEYAPEELLSAQDYHGEALPLQLCSVSDAQGTDRTQEVCMESGGIRFESPGIYILKVKAMDAWNRITVCEIGVPVNGGV